MKTNRKDAIYREIGWNENMTTNYPIYCDVTRRHDFLFLFDVTDGNPNGDPDSDSHPRIDWQTMQGLVSDGCVKRKIRDTVEMKVGGKENYRIFYNRDGVPLNALIRESNIAARSLAESLQVEATLLEPLTVAAPVAEVTPKRRGGKQKKNNGGGLSAEQRRQVENARKQYMCQHFWDIRAHGAVLNTGDYPAGQVHGPLQIFPSRSIDLIMSMDWRITRTSITEEGTEKKTTSTMGRKWVVPYGLYRGFGAFSPAYARKSGFSPDDFAIFWDAFQDMWQNDRSATRGRLALHGLYVFSHNTPEGNAHDYLLFDLVHVRRRDGVLYPRHIRDYEISIDEGSLPAGVVLTRLVG